MLPLLGCWLVLGRPPVLAQIPQSTPPPITSIPSTPSPVAPAPPEKDDVPRMLYPNAQISEILSAYELLTGKRLIAGNSVAGTISIVVNKPATKAQAISIIETALTLNGFSLVPGEGDIIKVVGLGDIVRSKGVPIYSDLADVPHNEQAVSFFLRLRYLDVQEVSGFLAQYIPAGNSVGYSLLPKSGALIITDTANSIRRMVSLLAQIDVPAAPVVEKFIRLERADASKAVEFLNAIFETKTAGASSGVPNAGQPGGNGNVRRPIRRLNEEGQVVPDLAALANVPGGLIALSGESIIQGRITLTADVRTNRVHVVTQPVNLPLVENLIAEYDSDTPFAEPVRRPLRFVSARDVLPILVQALTEPGSEQGQNGGNLPPGSTPRQSNNNVNSNSNNLFNNNSNSNGGFGSSGSGGNSLASEGLNTEAVDTTPTEAVVGSTKIIADQSANTIILLGGAEAKDKVFQILDQLDVRPPQVIIRALIGELSLGNNESTGLNYLLRQKGVALESRFNSALSGGTPAGTTATTLAATNSSTLQTLTNLAAGVGSGFSGLGGIVSITNSFDIILSALQSSNRFKTVSRPMVFTRNNKKAIIASGQEIAVPTTSLSSVNGTTADNASVATNVQFKSVTLKLEVVPLINSAGEVTLDILQTIDSIVSGQSVQIGGNIIPTIATRYIKSNVQAPNKSTIVLGGLTTASESKTSTDIPYLSKIPLLGDLLFKSRTRDQNRSELIVLLSPEVDNSPDTIEQKRRDEEQRLYLGGNLEDQLLPVAPAVRKRITKTTSRTVKRTETVPSPK